jgi:hypothetical protein
MQSWGSQNWCENGVLFLLSSPIPTKTPMICQDRLGTNSKKDSHSKPDDRFSSSHGRMGSTLAPNDVVVNVTGSRVQYQGKNVGGLYDLIKKPELKVRRLQTRGESSPDRPFSFLSFPFLSFPFLSFPFLFLFCFSLSEKILFGLIILTMIRVWKRTICQDRLRTNERNAQTNGRFAQAASSRSMLYSSTTAPGVETYVFSGSGE